MWLRLSTCITVALVLSAASAAGEVLIVDAKEHCIFMRERQFPENHAATLSLKPKTHYRISISGEAWMSDQTGAAADPFPGVVLQYCTNEQDGFADRVTVSKPGDKLSFVTPDKVGDDLFLTAFFIDFWKETPNHGQYKLTIRSRPDRVKHAEPSRHADRFLNIYFGTMLEGSPYSAAIGRQKDVWNNVKCREEHKTGLRFGDGSDSDVDLTLSANDGVWGITGHGGIYHAYLYHNDRNVDLSATVRYLPAGKYDVLIYAHGDAPNQNADIEILSGDNLYSGKSTLNDGTWEFRNEKLVEGNQYVKYEIEVAPDSPVVITSKRAGSSLSMLNAIQFKKLKSTSSESEVRDTAN